MTSKLKCLLKIVKAEMFAQFTMVNKEVSSAKSLNSEFSSCGRSFRYKRTTGVPEVIVGPPALITNWKIGNSNSTLFGVYYGGITQLTEEHSSYFTVKDLHGRPCQMLLINLEKHLVLLGKDWRQKHFMNY